MAFNASLFCLARGILYITRAILSSSTLEMRVRLAPLLAAVSGSIDSDERVQSFVRQDVIGSSSQLSVPENVKHHVSRKSDMKSWTLKGDA